MDMLDRIPAVYFHMIKNDLVSIVHAFQPLLMCLVFRRSIPRSALVFAQLNQQSRDV